MHRWLLAFALAWLAPSSPVTAQAPATRRDCLLARLVGHWIMRGTVRGKPATYRLEAAWTLQDRYVELHMIDVHLPPAYEARVTIGADTVPGRYLAHWLDNFGAAYSVPPATGRASGDTLTLDFPYPTTPFHDTFIFDRKTGSWTLRLESADRGGGWSRFADYRATRR